MKTSQQIRQALIQIAEKNNRPYYTAIVVRAVLEALKNSTYHPLVDQVNSHIDQIMPLSGQYSEKNDSPCELEPKEKNCSLCDESFPETKEFFFGRNIVKQPYVVTCLSAFKNLECQREFKAVQISLLGQGLGVAA